MFAAVTCPFRQRLGVARFDDIWPGQVRQSRDQFMNSIYVSLSGHSENIDLPSFHSNRALDALPETASFAPNDCLKPQGATPWPTRRSI